MRVRVCVTTACGMDGRNVIGAPTEMLTSQPDGSLLLSYACAAGFSLGSASPNRTCNTSTGELNEDVVCLEVFRVLHSLEVQGAPQCPGSDTTNSVKASLASMFPALVYSDLHIDFTCATTLQLGAETSAYSVALSIGVTDVQDAFLLVRRRRVLVVVCCLWCAVLVLCFVVLFCGVPS